MEISQTLKNKIVAHARSKYPQEMCGFIVNGDFIPVENIHAEPEKSFKISPEDYLQFAANCTAFIHSHPDWYPVPSEEDMRQQMVSNIPWGIIGVTKDQVSKIIFFGDSLPVPDLYMRPFIHGVTDCYSYIRHERFLRTGHWIPEIPRSWEWWLKEDQDLYKDNFKMAGYVQIPEDEIRSVGPQVGDVFLAITGKSKKLNHGGVYLGNGLGGHHLTSMKPYDESRVAKPDPLERWQKYITMWVRYENAP